MTLIQGNVPHTSKDRRDKPREPPPCYKECDLMLVEFWKWCVSVVVCVWERNVNSEGFVVCLVYLASFVMVEKRREEGGRDQIEKWKKMKDTHYVTIICSVIFLILQMQWLLLSIYVYLWLMSIRERNRIF